MKVSIDKEKCIKCGLCSSICPEVFDFGDDGVKVKENSLEKVDNEITEKLEMSKMSCPVEGIKIEDRPQK